MSEKPKVLLEIPKTKDGYADLRVVQGADGESAEYFDGEWRVVAFMPYTIASALLQMAGERDEKDKELEEWAYKCDGLRQENGNLRFYRQEFEKGLKERVGLAGDKEGLERRLKAAERGVENLREVQKGLLWTIGEERSAVADLREKLKDAERSRETWRILYGQIREAWEEKRKELDAKLEEAHREASQRLSVADVEDALRKHHIVLSANSRRALQEFTEAAGEYKADLKRVADAMQDELEADLGLAPRGPYLRVGYFDSREVEEIPIPEGRSWMVEGETLLVFEAGEASQFGMPIAVRTGIKSVDRIDPLPKEEAK